MKTINNKDRTIYVNLPNKLFKKLEGAIKDRNEKGEEPRLNLAQAAYLVNLVVYLPNSRNERYKDGWVPLASKILKSIKNSSLYMNFLISYKILERHPKNYSTTTGNCYRYRLPKEYSNHVVKGIKVNAHGSFIKARNKEREKRKEKADQSTDHLTKWLDPNLFHVDYFAALDFIKDEYQGKAQIEKKNKRIVAIENLKVKNWGYSREGKDDRLHSMLTRLPKDLKKFVSYSDFGSLRSLDIKSSQPFIFTSLIQTYYLYNTSCTQNHISDYLNKLNILSTMFDQNDHSIDIGALQSFVYEVLSGKFYEHYGQVLYEEGVLMKKVDNSYHFHGTTEEHGKVVFEYKTLREAAKDLIMITFFSSIDNNHNYVKVFKKTYPDAFSAMQNIKGIRREEKNFFSVLLQNIEANFILDFATKHISIDFPDIPLFTIHDSILTTEENITIVEQEFRKYLFKYFGLIPQLSRESWSLECEEAA